MKIILIGLLILIAAFLALYIFSKSPEDFISTPQIQLNFPTHSEPGEFKIGLPIRQEDIANNAMGLLPFGVHVADHGIDGHPGWDIEYKLNTPILVAADGEVNNLHKSPEHNDYNLRIDHRFGDKNFATDYVHMGTIADGITKGAKVKKGQIIGTPATQSRRIGKNEITYSIIHFQLNDFSKNEGLTNQNSVSPEDYLDEDGIKIFDTIWKNANYAAEIFEPFANNPRDITFPQITKWQLKDGDGPQNIVFKRQDAKVPIWNYEFLSGDEKTIEKGKISVYPEPQIGLKIEFMPESGTKKIGQVNIFEDTMNLKLEDSEQIYNLAKD